MTISIGTVVLSNDLCWLNEFDYPAVAQSAREKLDGTIYVQNHPMLRKSEIKLGSDTVGGGISGYFTRTQVLALKEYERTQSQVTFTYESRTMTIVIKSNGIDVKPIIRRPNQATTDWYTGTVTMIEV